MAQELSYKDAEILMAKSKAPMRAPAQGPENEISYEDAEKLGGAPVASKSVRKLNVEGEIPASTRAALSFASNDDEKEAYLQQEFPGIEISSLEGTAKNGKPGTRVVKMPGEARYKYIDDPSLTMKDVADFAGDVPAIGLGLLGGASVVGAGLGAAGGEAAKKVIGRKLIGIPDRQTLGQDVADVGISGILGGVVQGGFNKILGKSVLSGEGKAAAKGLVSEIPKPPPGAPPVGPSGGSPLGGEFSGTMNDVPAVQEIKDLTKTPASLEELKAAHKVKVSSGEASELPSSSRLKEAVAEIPDLKHKPIPGIHDEALKTQGARDILSVRKSIPGETADAVNSYEASMKGELGGKLDSTLEGLGNRPKTPNPIEAGETVLNSVKENYLKKQGQLGPIFERFKGVRIPREEQTAALRERLTREVPGLSGKLGIGPEGDLILAPYSQRMGMSKEAHNAIKEAISAINEGPMSFKDMQAVRESLRQAMDPVNPKAWRSVSEFRGSMLQHMQELMEAKGAKDLPGVRETMKDYAVNEAGRESFEKILGKRIEEASPDLVLKKVFANAKNMRTARLVMGEEEFQNSVGDLISHMVEKSSDKVKGFSSQKFSSELRRMEPLLREALDQGSFRRIHALVDIMRVIPDAIPANPSGTTKTGIISHILLGGSPTGIPSRAARGIGGLLSERSAGKAAEKELDAAIKGEPVSEVKKGLLSRSKEKIGGLLQNPKLRGGSAGLIGSEGNQGRK